MFSKACQYGIRSVIYICTESSKGNKVGAKEIAQKTGVPEPFIAKILQDLARKKIIGSTKGPAGGFFVDNTHQTLTLKQLVEAIDGDSLFSGCSLGLENCSEENPCPLHNEIKKIRGNIVRMLTQKSIREFAMEVENGDTVLSRLIEN
jgi:Rrf2 family protein